MERGGKKWMEEGWREKVKERKREEKGRGVVGERRRGRGWRRMDRCGGSRGHFLETVQSGAFLRQWRSLG